MVRVYWGNAQKRKETRRWKEGATAGDLPVSVILVWLSGNHQGQVRAFALALGEDSVDPNFWRLPDLTGFQGHFFGPKQSIIKATLNHITM